jgi:hypothetical protein
LGQGYIFQSGIKASHKQKAADDLRQRFACFIDPVESFLWLEVTKDRKHIRLFWEPKNFICDQVVVTWFILSAMNPGDNSIWLMLMYEA